MQLPLTIERQGLSQCIQPLQQFVCAHFTSLFCQLKEFLIANYIISMYFMKNYKQWNTYLPLKVSGHAGSQLCSP